MQLTSISLKGGAVSGLRGKNTSAKVMVTARRKTGMTPNLATHTHTHSKNKLDNIIYLELQQTQGYLRILRMMSQTRTKQNNFILYCKFFLSC